MKYVDPIRDKAWQQEFENYFINKNKRDYVMYMVGISLGLRIGDILPLRKRDIEGTHLKLEEQKTGKYKRIIIPPHLRRIFDDYTKDMNRLDYLFPSRTKSRTGKLKPIDRTTAYKIMKKAADEIGYTESIGTHTLRKTFGYNYYNKYKDVGGLMKLFNHTSETVTLFYIGAAQDDLDEKVAHLY